MKPVAPKPVATTTAQPSNTAAPATPGSTSGASTETPVAPAAPSTDPFSVPSYTPAAGQVDPRDATYWANLAKLQFNDRQEYAKNSAEQSNADTNYNFSLQQAIANRPIEERQLGEQAIKSNLGNSGWLGRSSAEQLTNYTNSRSQASLSKEQEDHARLAARQALVEGYGIDAAAEMAAAGGRFAQAQREEAGKGGPEAPPEAPPAGSAAGGGAARTNADQASPVKKVLNRRNKNVDRRA